MQYMQIHSYNFNIMHETSEELLATSDRSRSHSSHMYT